MFSQVSFCLSTGGYSSIWSHFNSQSLVPSSFSSLWSQVFSGGTPVRGYPHPGLGYPPRLGLGYPLDGTRVPPLPAGQAMDRISYGRHISCVFTQEDFVLNVCLFYSDFFWEIKDLPVFALGSVAKKNKQKLN